MSYDFRHQNGGLQEKGEAGGRGTHDRDTEDTHLCKRCVPRDGMDRTYGGCPQQSGGQDIRVQNIYLTAPCAGVIRTMLGTEFGEDEGKTAIIVRALYGLATAGASFRNHLTDCIWHLGHTSCLADPDLWYRPMVRPEDNYNYYSYVLLYVDNCLCICHDAKAEIHKIDKFFTMKKGSVCCRIHTGPCRRSNNLFV